MTVVVRQRGPTLSTVSKQKVVASELGALCELSVLSERSELSELSQ